MKQHRAHVLQRDTITFGAYLGGIETRAGGGGPRRPQEFGAYLGGIETRLIGDGLEDEAVFGAYLGGIETLQMRIIRK